HVVVRLGPVRAAAHLPEVDDVADEVDRVGLVLLEELQERLGLGGAGAEMNMLRTRVRYFVLTSGSMRAAVMARKKADSDHRVMTGVPLRSFRRRPGD